MAYNTQNLGLFCYDEDIDADNVFSISQALNENWTKIDNLVAKKTDIPTNCVSKTGDTMTGYLTMYYDRPFLNLNSSSVTYNEAPSEAALYEGISLNDKNGQYMGYLGIIRYLDNGTCIGLAARGADGVETSLGVQRLAGGVDNTYCPASDIPGSIVTTTGLSKSGNGYVRFGNGVMIQWGFIHESYNSSSWSAFPTTFPTACVAVNITLTTGTGAKIYAISTTGVRWISGDNWNNDDGYFIAIGY